MLAPDEKNMNGSRERNNLCSISDYLVWMLRYFIETLSDVKDQNTSIYMLEIPGSECC